MSDDRLAGIRTRVDRLRRETGDEEAQPSVAERDRIIDELLEIVAGYEEQESVLPGYSRAELLQGVVDAMPAAISVRDVEGRYVLVNRAMPPACGLTVAPGDFIGKTFLELQPLGAASAHATVLEPVLASGKPALGVLYESALQHGRWREMSAQPMRDSSGSIRGVLTVGLDVTDREYALNALRQSERRLSATVANIPGMVFRFKYELGRDAANSTREFEFVSAGVEELLGYQPGDFLDSRIRPELVVHPQDRELWREALHAAYSGDRPADLRLRMLRRDGQTRWVHQRSRVIERSGSSLVVQGVMIDVDSEMQATVEISRRNELLQTLIETIPGAGITMTDAVGRYLFVNEFAARQHNPAWVGRDLEGKTREELAGITPLTQPRQFHEEVLASGEPIVGREYPSEAAPDEWRQLFAAPVHGPQGEVQAVVAVHMDITGRKQTERALEEYRAHLEELVKRRTAALTQEIAERERAESALARNERLAGIGQLAATLGHELRNPLGTIRSSVATLGNHRDDDPIAYRRSLERIERNIDRCAHIIEQILDYTREHPLALSNTSIDTWCSAVASELEPPDGIAFVVNAASGAEVDIDRERLRHALVNVIENAWQAVMDSGQEREPRVAVATQASNGWVDVLISDNGPGVPPVDVDHIFEPLFSTKSFGVGLGLPLVKRLVEAHGGEVEVRTNPEGGATFVLRLPASNGRAREAG